MILLLPGYRRKSYLYDDIKRILLEDIPIISQIVLTGTINSSNTKVVAGKVITQICAKLGGVPWIMDELPLTQK